MLVLYRLTRTSDSLICILLHQTWADLVKNYPLYTADEYECDDFEYELVNESILYFSKEKYKELFPYTKLIPKGKHVVCTGLRLF